MHIDMWIILSWFLWLREGEQLIAKRLLCLALEQGLLYSLILAHAGVKRRAEEGVAIALRRKHISS